MTTLPPASLPVRPPRFGWMLAAALVATGSAFLLDQAAYDGLHSPRLADKDILWMMRVFGYYPTWLLVGAAMLLIESDPRGRAPAGGCAWRTLYVVLLPFLSGILASVLKVFVRRMRMDRETFELFAFRPFSEGLFEGSGLSFPSEHAAVAFSGALALSRLHPRAAWVCLFWAMGCAWSRVAVRSHYLSDVAGSLALALAVAWAFERRGVRALLGVAGAPAAPEQR